MEKGIKGFLREKKKSAMIEMGALQPKREYIFFELLTKRFFKRIGGNEKKNEI